MNVGNKSKKKKENKTKRKTKKENWKKKIEKNKMKKVGEYFCDNTQETAIFYLKKGEKM